MPVIVNLDDTFDLEVKNDTAWDLRREALEEGHSIFIVPWEEGFEYNPNKMTGRDLEGDSDGAKLRRKIFYDEEEQSRRDNNDVSLEAWCSWFKGERK
jgi:hypothetical protein